MRIRTAIKHYAQRNCLSFNETWIENLNHSVLAAIIPLNNGLSIVTDQVHPKNVDRWSDDPDKYPDDKGIIKKLTITVDGEEYDGEEIKLSLTESMKHYMDDLSSVSEQARGFRICCFFDMPEKLVDQFIKDNSGIDTKAYKEWLDDEFGKIPRARKHVM